MTDVMTHGPRGRTDRRERRLVYLIGVMLAAFVAWAAYFPLAEVSSGQGTVVPSSREQVIQSLEGGIIASLAVAEGSLVEANQVLAQLDPTRSASNVDEAAARYHASIAAAARLRAEIENAPTVQFPTALDSERFDELRANERVLFRSRQSSLQEAMSGLNEGHNLLNQEVEITQRLQNSGAASRVDLIRLQRDAAQTKLEIARLKADYRVKASEELQVVNAEAAVQGSIVRGRNDQLARLTLHAPMRGVVQDVVVTTIGGVVPPDLSPKFPPALGGVLGVKSLTLSGHLVHDPSLQEFHRGQVPQS
jgi:adhesin transport system membrane fusion protein